MKTKRLLALLLCLVMVVGILPMALSAESAAVAETGGKVTFNEFIDFNALSTSTSTSQQLLDSLINDSSLFSLGFYEGSNSSLSFVDRDGKGDIALRTTNKKGLTFSDKTLMLKDNSFVLEYDVRYEKVGGGFNTVQLAFKDNGAETKTALAPVNTEGGVDENGAKCPATYILTSQNLKGAKVIGNGKQNMPVLPDRWYHYAFYFDTLNNIATAYRDGEGIWSGSLTSFPDTMTECNIYMYSGANSSVTYYDNIHIQSFNSMDINLALDFEDISITGDATSVTATSSILTPGLGHENMMSYPYVHASNVTVEKDGNNQYLVMGTYGTNLGSGEKTCYMQLRDDQARLATTPWTMAFDICIPGVTDKNGNEITSNYDVSLFGLVSYSGSTYNKDTDYKNILIYRQNGSFVYGPSQSPTNSFTPKKGEWYRFFFTYNPTAKTITIKATGKDIGILEVGSFAFNPPQNDIYTYFRFGYSWQGSQYAKFCFDNMTLTTEQNLNIDLDFENGTANESVDLADLSLGGGKTFTVVNGSSYSKNQNGNFKYLVDDNGNTFLGSFVGHNTSYININDATLNTLSKKFVMSFDFKINEKATTYTMASWRTSAANIPLWVIETVEGKTKLRVRPKLTGSAYAYSTPYLTSGTWYNFAVVIDPINKTAAFHMGGVDTEPVYTTVFEHSLDEVTWSAFSIGPGSNKFDDGTKDYIGYDNIRIYTIDENIEDTAIPDNINAATLPTSGVIIETDFENFATGTAMTSEAWNSVAPFWATSTDGIIVESNGNKHFQPASGSGATSFNISSASVTPYTEGVIAVESDFTLGNNSSNSGKLIIASLKRVSTNGKTIDVPLLTTTASGKLTVAQQDIDYTLPQTTVRIRLELSYAFHSVNLYINGKAIATGIPLKVNTVVSAPDTQYFADSFGNQHAIPFTGYIYDYGFSLLGTQIKNADGTNAMFPRYYENYGFAQSISYVKDSIEMFNASANEAWSFAMDNLKIYLDKNADLYYNGFDSWVSGVVGTKEYGTTVEIPFAAKGAKYVDDNGNRVLSTLSETSDVYNASFFITDANQLLVGKTFVLEFDIKYNPDFALLDLGTSAENGMAILTDLKWRHSIRLAPDGGFGVPDASTPSGYLKANDWSKVQILFMPNGTGHSSRIYVDGMLTSNVVSLSLTDTVRIGCEANAYDAKFDNIRIYLSDRPDASESIIEGTLEGKTLFSLEIADRASLEAMMANKKAGLTWNFKTFETTTKNINEASVNVLLDKGDYVRVMHKELKASSPYNILVNKAALEGHKQYVFETEFRYTCPTGFELEVISSFDATTQTTDRLVYVLGASREIVFNRNGFTYNLTDANGNKLYAENVTEDATEFTKIAVIVDEVAENYSVYVNDRVAYYNYGGNIVSATEITIDKTPVFNPAATIPQIASTLSLLNLSTSTSADALLDIKSANFYVLRTGIAPYVMATQSKVEATACDVRFIAPIDMIYGSEVGFDITTSAKNSKEVTRSSDVVYSSIKAIDPETGSERSFSAEEFDGTYLAVIKVTGASIVDTVEYTVRPFIIIGDSKIYNESFTVTYSDGKVVTE